MHLQLNDLSFAYRRQQVLSALDWELPTGARVVLLGPNGAGKSTLMRLCAGLLRPASGEVLIDGAPADSTALSRHVALMPQHVTAVPRLSCREQVSYAGWLGGLTTATAQARADAALEAVALSDKAAARSKELPGGQLRRLGLAEALVRETGLVMLDEPTAGLDPAQRARFRGVLAALPPQTSIVVSTHETHDIVEAFDRVCILADGRFLLDGPANTLLESTGAPTVEAAYTRLLEAE